MSHAPRPSRRGWRAFALLLLLGVAAAPPPDPPWPRVIAGGFAETSAFGATTLRFLDLHALDPNHEAEPSLAERRLLARAYLQLTDTLAAGWDDPNAPVSLWVKDGLGATTFPPMDTLWASLSGVGDKPHAVSTPAAALAPYDDDGLAWVGPVGGQGLFERTSWRDSLGSPTPDVVLIAGRFASRLSAEGAPVSAQWINGGAKDAAPFLEQILPIRPEVAATGGWMRPLRSFDTDPGELTLASARLCDAGHDEATPDALSQPRRPALPIFTRATTAACARGLASAHTRRILDDLGRVLHSFGTPARTDVQTRMLAAMSVIGAPPGAYPGLPRISLDDLNVSSVGQLDPEEMKRADPAPKGAPGPLHIDPSALPTEVVWDELHRLFPPGPQERAALAALDSETLYGLTRRYLREEQDPTTLGPLAALSPEAISAWSVLHARPGRQTILAQELPWRALGALLEAHVPEADRPEERRRVLDAHLRYLSFPNLDAKSVATPAAMRKQASDAWKIVNTAHGGLPVALPQPGPDTVDPTAICTVGDGPNALKEKVQRQISVDLLYARPMKEAPGLDGLWESRAALPFVFVDDPELTRGGVPVSGPHITRLGPLPDGRALHRARYTLWTGWHLLYQSGAIRHEGIAIEADHELILRVAALCDDMILSHESLLPALSLAALKPGGTAPDAPEWDEVADALVRPLRDAALGPAGVVLMIAELAPPDTDRRLGLPQAPAITLGPRRPRKSGRRQVHAWATLWPTDPDAPQKALAPDWVLQSVSAADAVTAAGGDGAAIEGTVANPSISAYRPRVLTGAEGGAAVALYLDTINPTTGELAPAFDAMKTVELGLWDRPRLTLMSGAGVWAAGWPTTPTDPDAALPNLPRPTLGVTGMVGLRWVWRPLRLSVSNEARSPWGAQAPSGRYEAARVALSARGGVCTATTAGATESWWWAEAAPSFALPSAARPAQSAWAHEPDLWLSPTARVMGCLSCEAAASPSVLFGVRLDGDLRGRATRSP